MPFKAIYLDPQGQLKQGLDEAAIGAALASRQGALWVDFYNTTPEDGELMQRVFNFHPLAVEDCVDPDVNIPKLEEFDGHLFLILHGINYTLEEEVIKTTELDLFLGPNFLVSSHNNFLHSVESVAQQVEQDGRFLRRGVDFLAHALIDALVNNIVPLIDRFIERADLLEESIFRNPHPSTLEDILNLKRSSLRLRRALTPQREVLNRLSRSDLAHITIDSQIFYRDVYDTMARIEAINENYRERLDTMLATYLSALAYQQNETMKRLSLVAAVFLPLTLLTGIYGMNFERMPELHWEWGYFIVLGVIVTAVAGTFWGFWLRAWIRSHRHRLERFVPTAISPEKLLTRRGNRHHFRHQQRHRR